MVTEAVRRGARTGDEPEVLVLSPDPDRMVARGGPTSVNPKRIIDLLRREELSLARLRSLVGFAPADDAAAFIADIGFIVSKAGGSPSVILMSESSLKPDDLTQIPGYRFRHEDLRTSVPTKGPSTMPGSSRNFIDNPDELKAQLKDILQTIHDDEDPHELTAYKKFVKQHVSVFSRAYLTAYLVKLLAEGGNLRIPSRSSASTGKAGARNRKERPERGERKSRGDQREARPARASRDAREDDNTTGNVAPEDRQTLFVSVGKNRRVYPKDFVALFAELDGVDGDDIGQIKILDNYSFVEVDKTVADTIIGAYDGYEFRGRKLTVNYARSKKD